MEKSIALPTLKRLPAYYKIICQAVDSGDKYISSPTIAALLEIDDSQIRKDIASTGYVGKPKVGFETASLKSHLEEFLGLKKTREAFLIGAGNLGIALSKYQGFTKYGLEILALFDNDPLKVGLKISDKEVFPMSKLPNLISRMHIQIAILTVPAINAQITTDYLVKSGIKAIWNYTPSALSVPEDVAVWNEDLGASYVIFSHIIDQKLKGN